MKMNYVVLGTNDMERAVAFYEDLFEGQNLNKVHPTNRMTYFLGEDFAFALATPFDGNPASVGNGTMIGFALGASDEVERRHALGLSLGGTCEGAPGPRGPRFSAYLRDLDGNKLCLSD